MKGIRFLTATDVNWTGTWGGHLRGVNLYVNGGDVILVAGSNGVGKSVFLRILAGIIRPDSGEVHIDALNECRGVILVCADDLRSDDTVGEALLAVQGATPQRDDGEELLERLGLNIDQKIGLLSSGEALRLQFTMAVSSSADVLLLDAPSAELDSDGYDELVQLITEESDRGRAIVIATVDPELILRLDQAVLHSLHEGQLTRMRPPPEAR